MDFCDKCWGWECKGIMYEIEYDEEVYSMCGADEKSAIRTLCERQLNDEGQLFNLVEQVKVNGKTYEIMAEEDVKYSIDIVDSE